MRYAFQQLTTPAEPLVVVDAGATGGLHPRWTGLTPHRIVVAFDPDPRASVDSEGSGLVVVPKALGEEEGAQTLYLCRKPECSSLLEPNREILDLYPDKERFDIVDTLSVECVSLDFALRSQGIPRAHFIKIDTQGYALPILRGADKTLTNVIGVEVELEFLEIYKGESLFHEVDAHLLGKGFQVYDIRRYFWRRETDRLWLRRKGQLVFADALYLRTPEALLSSEDCLEVLPRAFLIYVAYGFMDLADVLHHGCAKGGLLPSGTLREMEEFLRGQSAGLRWPRIPGMGRVARVLSNVTDRFQPTRFYFGTDERLGNRRPGRGAS